MKSIHFRPIITPLSEKQSEGKWDYRIVVTRLTDGMTKTDRISGGWVIAEACANRLARELGMDETATL